jgi:ribosomal protein S12 methylthiotransferase
MKKTVYMVSLGCPKNLVDSEVMLGQLEKAGYESTPTPDTANLLLVNTCGFIGSAVEEAIDEILALVKYKEDGTRRLAVTGCLVQRYGKELQNELPEVDIFVGTEGINKIIELLDAPPGSKSRLTAPAIPFLMKNTTPRKVSTPGNRAYLKITEGCDNRCSYCLIPSIRGRLRSRSISDLAAETRKLSTGGVQELTLIAQDLLAYGRDLDHQTNLTQLLRQLLAVSDIPWLRLLYLHPARLDHNFLAFIAENPRILPYLDIPIQHVNDRILKLMGRPYGKKILEQLIADIRKTLPTAVIRTTVMVGFPGEKEADFKEMVDFLQQHRFDHVGVFAYSNEEGCRAEALPDHCDEELKEARRQRVMELQAEISQAGLKRYLGKELSVLVEGVSQETDLLLEGRAWFQAPDIDGCVYISSGHSLPGAMVDVRVTDSDYYDLVGEIIEKSA